MSKIPFDEISIVYRDEHVLDGSKGITDALEDAMLKVGRISARTLAENLQTLSNSMSAILEGIEIPNLPYALEEIGVTVELTGSGEVRLVGSVGAEITGGITLTFRRR